MRQLFPVLPDPAADVDPVDAYAYRLPPGGRPWLRANMVSSVDGSASWRGRTADLSDEADRRMLALLRALSDVVLVGAGTARVERYGPAHVREEFRPLRAGRSERPPIAVVTHRLNMDLSGPLFAPAPPECRTIVITTGLADPEVLAEAERRAEVIVAGERRVDPHFAVAELARRGHRRLLCEGGPTLLAQLVQADLLDELCLTLTPVLCAGDAPRVLDGPALERPRTLSTARLLHSGDTYFFQYTRDSGR
ncbi:pyrimidine reductase family protein [Allonocardiopsis opalescens]|uniref:Riboflavin biosynthesis pyrimidine reductase n=1 Tax=Allonocardiopsis opalescens TaxID=1144618 RepID=A0A2T0PUG6_9ACTN|nr:pyrimidine reductase family protein [Allonocardiopsis opalescens]PRX92376.1 riboflavin biosynthesis pyrimidine reductase [Allonocardiopsis opalescens]